MSEAKKPVLALDLDDVVVDFTGPCINYYNHRYSGSLNVLSMKRFFHPDDMGLDYQEAVRRVGSFHETGASQIAPPIRSSLEDLPELASLVNLQIVTARQQQFEEITLGWIENHASGYFDDVHLANHFTNGKESRSKLDICRSIGAIGLVDDNPQHVTEAADNGLLGFLHGNYAWNRATPAHPNIIEVSRLSDVSDFLKRVGFIAR